MKTETLRYKRLEGGITSKAVALGLEAIHAARQMLKDPRGCRGGPWPRPTLPPDWRALAKRVAACRSLLTLNGIADECIGGRLDRHSKDARFAADPEATPNAIRGAKYSAAKSNKSGVPGNVTRKRQLQRGDYARGSERHLRLKRGVHWRDRSS